MDFKAIIKEFFETKDRRKRDMQRMQLMNNCISDVLEMEIRQMFHKRETIHELTQRMVPINVFSKIIKKQAKTYLNPPSRMSMKRDVMDDDMIEIFAQQVDLDRLMDVVEETIISSKKCLIELCITDHFKAKIIEPQYYLKKMDCVVKAINLDFDDPKKSEFEVWYKEDDKVMIAYVDGDGMLMNPPMDLDLHYFPFVEVLEKFNGEKYEDKDTLKYSKIIPILGSDISHAIKYQTYSLIHTIGMKGDIEMMPNSLISSDFTEDGKEPRIEVISPKVNIVETMEFIKFIVGALLSQNNLSASSIQTELGSADHYSSGIARIIDSAELIDERKSRRPSLEMAEKELFTLVKNMTMERAPIEGFRGFSEDFELVINYQDQKVIMSETEKINLAKLKIDSGFSTVRRELEMLNPEMDDKMIDQLLMEIQDEKAGKMMQIVDEMNGEEIS